MGRPSNRAERRAQILDAFARVLADHGYAGATIAAIAAEADLTPGLLHHHFESKEEMLSALLDVLITGFRSRVSHYETESGRLGAYVDGATLVLGAFAPRKTAGFAAPVCTGCSRRWVGSPPSLHELQGLMGR